MAMIIIAAGIVVAFIFAFFIFFVNKPTTWDDLLERYGDEDNFEE